MADNPSVLPDFIPPDVVDEYQEEARRRVAAAHRHRVRAPRARRRPRPGPLAQFAASPPRVLPQPIQQKKPLAVAALVALLGSVWLSVLWAWLAITTGEAIWWWVTGGGAAVALVSALGSAMVASVSRGSPRSRR